MSQWTCAVCGQAQAASLRQYRCVCGGVLESSYVPRFPVDLWAGRAAGMWRYAEALPLGGALPVSLGEPSTPLVPVTVEGVSVLVKQEQLFPTGSFKDRGAALLVTLARASGVSSIVEDSSGNAGCALAAYAARAGLRCNVFVPEGTSASKLVQMEACGATVTRVPGSREKTALAVRDAAQSCFYASHTYNPWFIDGVKTFGYELAEQLDYETPDWIVVPAGNGTLLLGCYKAFGDLVEAGICSRLPRMIGVQAAACAPLVEAFNGGESKPQRIDPKPTVAEGIAIASPARGWQMLKAVSRSGGWFEAVDDAQILDAQHVAATQGFFVEPTAAVGLAGAAALLRQGRIGGTVVTVFTGHGLKHVH